jgi:hypothetical protein
LEDDPERPLEQADRDSRLLEALPHRRTFRGLVRLDLAPGKFGASRLLRRIIRPLSDEHPPRVHHDGDGDPAKFHAGFCTRLSNRPGEPITL